MSTRRLTPKEVCVPKPTEKKFRNLPFQNLFNIYKGHAKKHFVTVLPSIAFLKPPVFLRKMAVVATYSVKINYTHFKYFMPLKCKSRPGVLFPRAKLLYQSVISHRNGQTFSWCFTERCLARCICSNSEQIYTALSQASPRRKSFTDLRY